MSTNYSYETSGIAYHAEQNEKKLQRFRILDLVRQGSDCLLKIAEQTGLPQSTVSGRCGDLILDKKIMYSGKVFYKKFTRKRIVSVGKVEQANLFL